MLGLKQRAPPKRAGSYGHSTASGRSGGTTSSKESKWETEDIVLMVIIAVVVLLVVVAIGMVVYSVGSGGSKTGSCNIMSYNLSTNSLISCPSFTSR